MADSVHDLIALQLVKQAAFGTGITTATYNLAGTGNVIFHDTVVRKKYMTGQPGKRTVEHAFIADTETEINIADSPASSTLLVWMFNHAIKTILGPATSFAFALPTSGTANSITAFSYKLSTLADTYDVADCFITNFNLHGDVDADNGQVLFNAKLAGRKASPSGALTASLGLIPYHIANPFNLNNATVKIAALGSAPSGGTDQAGEVLGVSLDWVTGYYPGRGAGGRSARDYYAIRGGALAYDGTGKFKFLLGAKAVTQIANTRAGTGINVQILLNGNGTHTCTIVLPVIFTGELQIGNASSKEMSVVEFGFEVGPSETATALHPSFTVATGTDSVTVT